MTDEASKSGESDAARNPADVAALSKMRARAFFPADHAAVENGKVYTSGAFWSTLRFPAFPAVLPTMALVAVIEIPFHANQADHVIELKLIDLDENPAGLEARGVFRSAPSIDAKYGAPGLAPTAIPVQGLVFQRAGEYAFVLKVDNVELARYPVTVIQLAGVPIMQPPAAPPWE